MPWRVIFFGTAELACATLKALATDPNIELLAVVTQPDKPRGRDLQLQPSAVKKTALELKLPVLQPVKARDPAFIEEIRALTPDLMVVAAYGQILPQSLLSVPAHGCLNVHTSILPKHRGAAPIQWAILCGDSETGVTIMQMDAGLDTGPIISLERTPISPSDNSQTLHDRLAQIGAALLVRTIPPYIRGELPPQAQPEGATYARKISREDGLIRWEEPALQIWHKLRAFTPWPGAYSFLEVNGQEKLLKVLSAEPIPSDSSQPPGSVILANSAGIDVRCGVDALRLTEIQLEGRKKMSAREFLAGNPISPGTRLSNRAAA